MRLLAVALTLIVAACSLGDFAGYTGGASPGDASTSDVTTNADAGSENDGASEGSTSANDAGPFCEVNGDAAFFCEDFEGPNPLLHFSSMRTTGGTLIVDKGEMVADAPASDAGAELFGVVSTKRTGSKATIAFRVRPEILNTTTDNANQIAKLYFFGDTGPSYEVGVGIHGAGSSAVYAYEYTSGGAYKEFGDLASLAGNASTRFVLDVSIASGAPRITLDRDGMRVVDAPLTPPRNIGAIEAYVGLPYVPVLHGAWKVRLDDILMSLP